VPTIWLLWPVRETALRALCGMSSSAHNVLDLRGLASTRMRARAPALTLRTVRRGAVRTCLQIDPRNEDVLTVSTWLELALFVDAKLEVSKV
jgi:hypothetical protein